MSLFNLFDTIIKKLNASVKTDKQFEDIVWDGNTEGLETFSVDLRPNVNFTLHCYLVSEQIITKEQALGATFKWEENGERKVVISENTSGTAVISFSDNGSTYEKGEARFACVTEDNTELDYSTTLRTKIVYPKAGVWFCKGEIKSGIFFTATSLIASPKLIGEEYLPDIFIRKTEKGTRNGVAQLDSDGKIYASQLPDGIGSGSGSGVEQVQADYNQNDETAVDYIKNRPFYKEVELIPCYEGEYTSSLNSSYGIYHGTITYTNPPENYPPEKLNITLDGVEYKEQSVVKTDALGYMCGNLSKLNSLMGTSFADTGEPFVIGVDRQWAMVVTDTTQSTTHNLVINIAIVDITPIDREFLPKEITFINKGTGEGSELFNDEANIASGDYSHAEGSNTEASGDYSHAEGQETTASGECSHAGGYGTTASAYASYAEGNGTTASGIGSHAKGRGTVAASSDQHAQGRYNIPDPDDVYAHIVGNGLQAGERNAHTLDWKGNAMFAGTVSSTGADYAEFFEWADGNPDKEDRIGLLVAFEGEKIRPAQADDKILGIVSGTAMVLGDNAEWEWQGKYLTDDFGRVIYEMVEEFIEIKNPETGETEKKSVGFFPHGKINPEWDSSQTYVSRINRPEWATIGLMGKIHALDDGSCVVGGYATIGENGIATASERTTNMYVMKRITDNIVLLFVKAPEW